jgi:hypothetical protein
MARVRYGITSIAGTIDDCSRPQEASLELKPTPISGDAWSLLSDRARLSDTEAYQALYPRLEEFRAYFKCQLFPNPEAAYSDFVRGLVNQIRCGLAPDGQALLAQARRNALRAIVVRVNSLTEAARLLSGIPKRDREALIRSQQTLHATRRLTAVVA